MINPISLSRLAEERKRLRQDRPVGFFARPTIDTQGNLNLFRWECGIPGKSSSVWSGHTYKLMMEFDNDYPARPPICRFVQPLFHPNIFPSGTVCLNILNEDSGWQPSISVKDILVAIQELLDNPNILSPAQREPYELFKKSKVEYNKRIRNQVKLLNEETKKSK